MFFRVARVAGSGVFALLLAATGCTPTAAPEEAAGGDPSRLERSLGSALPTLEATFVSSRGWVRPGEQYPFLVKYSGGALGTGAGTITVTLPPSARFVSSTPAPAGGTGSAADPLHYPVPALGPDAGGRIVLVARALGLAEDPEIVWKDLSASASYQYSPLSPALGARTLGPRVTTLESARYGVRPFPVINVQYQDITHCTGAGVPYPECARGHTSADLDEAVNSRLSGTSVWQLYQDLSLEQLSPEGAVPSSGRGTVPFSAPGTHRFSSLAPQGTCTGATVAALHGTPLYPNRIVDGWYQLPGTQAYYGADRTGHALVGALTGAGLLFGVDDACGPTGKLVYDAASLADPDLDYNDFDTDRDGVVDFFMVVFAGDGGNGNTTVTGLNNVWPHSSDLRFYFTGPDGQTGYVSSDQLRDPQERPLWWTDATRTARTTVDLGEALKAYVRVGPYNVNPEPAADFISVIAHEYGHSLGLPDFYSLGDRSTFGTWELMAADHAQFMTVYSRQDMGWVVPRELADGTFTLRESKQDTHAIAWKRPDGTPYTLSGEDVHNADVYRVSLPTAPLIDQVPSGTRAWFSGSGNDFGCPAPGTPTDAGHGLLIHLPELAQHAGATSARLKLKTYYEMEWDYDYGFVLVSSDGGRTWASLPSQRGTTLSGLNPNASTCYAAWGNGITGVSGEPNTATNANRLLSSYPAPRWVDDEFDLTPHLTGEGLLVLLSYSTDPGLKKRGWFVDDVEVTVTPAAGGAVTVYRSDFEADDERTRLFPSGREGWRRIAAGQGVEVDHGYWLELRDRVSWDLDGRGENDRGPITWQPGVSVLYADESRGYGNVGVDDPPAVTPVDAVPEPGSSAPNLDDAAFTAARSRFDGCAHVDNYADPSGPGGRWKLPAGLSFQVASLAGLSQDGVPPSSALATLVVDVAPDCAAPAPQPPILSFGPDRDDPDPDGRYTLTWTRPAGATGPDELEETTTLSTLVSDGAEGGLSGWTVTTSGTGAFAWERSDLKRHGGGFAFWARALDGSTNAESVMELAAPIQVPASGATALTFWDWYIAESDDAALVEVRREGQVTWEPVLSQSRFALAPDAAAAFAGEGMFPRSVDLSAKYAGKTIRLRFRFVSGPENKNGSNPSLGWFVDDVAVTTAGWRPLAAVSGTSYLREGRLAGTYHYRVRSTFPFGSAASVPGPFRDPVSVRVTNTVRPDGDGDGVADADDNCPAAANPSQANADGDALGDACDACPADAANDGDGDGVCGDADNCAALANPSQVDGDGDGLGDACDACAADPANDADGDGVCGNADNCPLVRNPDQLDGDRDGRGDACDAPCSADKDWDRVCNGTDNCLKAPNPDQRDSDGDGKGDACDPG